MASSSGEKAIGVTPPLDSGVTPIPRSDWRPYESLKVFNLRNGVPEDAETLLIKATVPAGYHWTPVDRVTPTDAKNVTDGYILSALSRLSSNRPAGMNDASMRKAAICLGVARAAVTTYYDVVDGEFIPGEVAPAVLRAGKATDGSLALHRINANGPDPVLDAGFEPTELEKDVIAELMKFAIGIPAMQGYSLVMCNHHFLDARDTQSFKCFNVVERAHWTRAGIAEWFNTDRDLIRDCLWHKSCHPLQISMKVRVAMNPQIPIFLRNAGAGATASRLPAVESELRAAGSYVTCLDSVRAILNTAGGDVNFDAIATAVEVAKAYPVGVDNPTARPTLPPGFPVEPKNRSEALRYLGAILQRNKGVVAWCYGFYCAVADANIALTTTAATPSLINSNSLERLKQDSSGNFYAGAMAFQHFSTSLNNQVKEGNWAAPMFTIA